MGKSYEKPFAPAHPRDTPEYIEQLRAYLLEYAPRDDVRWVLVRLWDLEHAS